MIEQEVSVESIGYGWAEVCASHFDCNACARGCLPTRAGIIILPLSMPAASPPVPSIRSGRRMIVSIPEKTLLKATVTAFVYPIVGLFFGAVAGRNLSGLVRPEWTEPGSMLGGVIGLLGAYVLVRALLNRRGSALRTPTLRALD